jgi:ATP-dependent exoDNAse (exonuclease V) alpha subunit
MPTRDMVHAAETREAARGELIERWDRAPAGQPRRQPIILTHTNDEVRELNDAAREAARSGDLGDDVDDRTRRAPFASGDRIMFLRNERGWASRTARSAPSNG